MAQAAKTIAADWRPGWYELDQGIEVGRTAQRAFFRPRADVGNESLVFYNTLWNPDDAVAGWGTVVRITHPVLGDLLKVDTKGLDYAFVLADGQRLIVDAEEAPGKLFVESGGIWRREIPRIESWNLLVEIADLTPLQRAPARLEGP